VKIELYNLDYSLNGFCPRATDLPCFMFVRRKQHMQMKHLLLNDDTTINEKIDVKYQANIAQKLGGAQLNRKTQRFSRFLIQRLFFIFKLLFIS